MTQTSGLADFFIRAATTAADLNKVQKTARQISLEAMNAKTLLARAGDSATAFKPITDFMNEVASSTIGLARTINAEALSVSRTSLAKTRSEETIARLKRALDSSKDAAFRTSVQPALETAGKEQEELDLALTRHKSRLMQVLDDIERQMTAAEIVSATSRMEAVGVSSGYADSFKQLADNLRDAAEVIRRCISVNRKRLAGR